MRQSILIPIITSIIFFSGCGDQKSTGELMAESVAKLRGEQPRTVYNTKQEDNSKNVVKKIAKPEVKERAKTESEKIEEIEINSTKPKKIKNSLQDIAHNAINDIKKATESALENSKKVIQKSKESADSALSSTLSPALDKVKEDVTSGISKIKALLETETNSSN